MNSSEGVGAGFEGQWMCLGAMYGVKGKKGGGDQQCMQRSHEISVGRQDPAMPLNTRGRRCQCIEDGGKKEGAVM